jgi:hypothetical protein
MIDQDLHAAAFPKLDKAQRAALVGRACGWCNQFFADEQWLEMEEAFPRLGLLEYPEQRRLTHGMCEVGFGARSS